MCAIGGIIGGGNVKRGLLIERMMMVLAHRGPDGRGYYEDDFVSLGHNRLSIIDLSQRATQPMTSLDGLKIITFNGEIYNYIELRKYLEDKKYKFKSNSDTEVILASYEEWGTECLARFNGMWAFALWDREKKELFCARDRLGVKPFYFYLKNGFFTFASEIKGLLAIPDILTSPNECLIYDFLRYGMLDHENKTFFNNIEKLEAGTFLIIDHQGNIVKQKKYWDFSVSDDIYSSTEYSYYNKHFKDLLIDSVRLRLRSDVPIGTCLSGGIDSSSLVCIINKLLNDNDNDRIRQKTFSFYYALRGFDERPYINSVIAHTGVDNDSTTSSYNVFRQELDSILWHQEEPFLNINILGQWLVMKRAAQRGIKVILNGQGADEYLCGYRKFYFFYIIKLLNEKKYSDFLREIIYAVFLRGIFNNTSILKNGLRYVFPYHSYNSSLLNKDFYSSFQYRKLDYIFNGNLGNRIKNDVIKWSLPVLLRYEDKNSMAFSIETRLPFLDYRLVQFASTLPLNFRMHNGWTKKILRDSMKDIIPDFVRVRTGKLGYSVPGNKWFNEGLAKAMEITFLESTFITPFIHRENLILELNRSIKKGFSLDYKIFFKFYILELWGRKFITK